MTISLPAKHPLIRAAWRTQATFLMTIPLYFGLYFMNRENMSISRDHSLRMLFNSAITAAFDFSWYVGLVASISMTVTSHAMVLFSATGVYMFAFSVLTCAAVHRFEYLGYAFFAIGVLLMLTDPFATKIDGGGNQFLGDIIAFVSAGAGAILGVYNSNNAKIIHPIILLGQVSFFSIIYQIVFC